LIFLGQLCDDNCVAILDKTKINVFKHDTCILSGTCNPTDGLWDTPLPLTQARSKKQSFPQQANPIIRKDQTKTELAQHLYGCCGSPAVSTWKMAIKNGNFITWPGIDTISLDRDLPKSVASTKGHLDQERKNLQSTRTAQPILNPISTDDDDPDNFFPAPDTPNLKSFEAYAQIIPFVAKNTAYHDLTGRFPHRSARGNEYLLIVYDHDSNSILQSPLKNKTGAEIKRGWVSIHEHLAKGGNQPKLYILDNEASADLKRTLRKYELTYQLAWCTSSCTPPKLRRACYSQVQKSPLSFPRYL
jgi:hypothetical protein